MENGKTGAPSAAARQKVALEISRHFGRVKSHQLEPVSFPLSARNG